MTIYSGTGTGVGAGGARSFLLGEPNNIFGATSGSNDLSTVTAATSRAVAEATRDAYDTANPTWLPNYTNEDVNIILYYTSSGSQFVQYQRRVGTEWVNNNQAVSGIRGQRGVDGSDGVDGTDGNNGWSPVLAIVSDGTRRVFQVNDWQGGEGTKPTTGMYVGNSGLVTDIAQAVDVRGATGATGAQGNAGADGADGTDGTDGIGIQSITSTQSNTTVTVTVTLTDGTTRTFSFTNDGGTPTPPTNEFKVFTQASSTVTEQNIEDVTEMGTRLPYLVVLSSPMNNLVVAWHSSTEVTDIYINILDSGEGVDDIITSPVGNRFLRSSTLR